MKINRINIISVLFFSLLMNNHSVAQSDDRITSINSIYSFNQNTSFSDTDISTLINFKLKTLQFDSYAHTQKIVNQLKKFNLVIADTDDQMDGWIKMPFKTLDKWFFEDYYIDYQQHELKRLLPQPPDIWFLDYRSH